MKTKQKNSSGYRLLLLILALIFVSLFTFSSVYNSMLNQQETRLKSMLKNQSHAIKMALDPAINAPNQYRKNLSQTQALEKIDRLWKNLKEYNTNLDLWLVHQTSSNDQARILLTTNQRSLAGHDNDLINLLAQKALSQTSPLIALDKSMVDYYFNFSGYAVIIPQQWVLIIHSDSTQINHLILNALTYTFIATILIILLTALILNRRTTQAQTQNQIRYEELISNAHNWVWETDINGLILFSNPEVEEILGYRLLDMQNQPIYKYFDINFNHNTQLIFKQKLMQREAFDHLEIAFRHYQGHTVHLLMSAFPIEQGKRLIFRGLAIDISTTKNRENKIINQAFYDPLTGLINRQHFIDQLDKHIQRKKVTKEPKTSAVLFIDLDGFKKVNDTNGHEAGDQLLKIIAKRLKAQTRESDLLSRFGGDEFVMLIKSQADDELRNFNQKLEACLKRTIESVNEEIIIDKVSLHVGASVGVALIPQDGKNVTEILNHADMAMYEAKARGKNTYEFFNLQTKSAVDKKMKTSGELEKAIENQELELYYQLQYQGNRIKGIEALLRWHHPVSRKIVPAQEFIEEMSSQYQTHIIDEWVINRVAQDMATFNNRLNVAIPVSINLSTQEMFESNLPSCIKDVLKKHQVNPQQLSIEVSENILAENFAQTSLTIKKLDQLGVSTVIDHFGTGHLSLANLQRMPIKAIKIDSSFTNHIATRHSDLQMSRAIIQLAKAMHISVLAGCVETSVQKDLLLQEGCDILQGFHYSKPVSLEKMIEVIKHKSTQI